MTEPSRGEIWMVNLNPVRGHEQAGRRPGLVVSVDLFNHGPAGLVVLLPVTSVRKCIPFHVQVEPAGRWAQGAELCQVRGHPFRLQGTDVEEAGSSVWQHTRRGGRETPNPAKPFRRHWSTPAAERPGAITDVVGHSRVMGGKHDFGSSSGLNREREYGGLR